MKYDLVIYHGRCPDGIAAAWCLWRENKELEFYAGAHNEPPPDVKDKRVIMVDFSYPIETMKQLVSSAISIRILDHHKSAEPLKELTADNFSCVIDMDRSGAQITWDEFNPKKPRPWFIDDIGDRDLWRWEVAGSRAVTRAMSKYYTTFETFNELTDEDRNEFLIKGNALLEDDERMYTTMAKAAIDCTLGEFKCRLVECSFGEHISDLGNTLVLDQKADFSVMYRYDFFGNRWRLSLRAHPDSDVSVLDAIKLLGGDGGGHVKAGGCVVKGNLQDYFKPVETEDRFYKTV
jgi:oligoribonuclease NrnB/cAMP/cGMP phosphodiesterase (DHH superfamily)